MSVKTHYEILDIEITATARQIKESYRLNAAAWHPDGHKGTNKQKAEERMKLINGAYQVLRDPQTRMEYDNTLLNSHHASGGSQNRAEREHRQRTEEKQRQWEAEERLRKQEERQRQREAEERLKEQEEKRKRDEEKRKWEEGAPLRAAEERKRQEEAKRQSEALELQRQNAEEERKQLEQKVKQSKIISPLLDIVMGAIIIVIFITTSSGQKAEAEAFPVILGWSLGILIPIGLGLIVRPILGIEIGGISHTDKDITKYHSSENPPLPYYIPAKIYETIILGIISGALICGFLYSYVSYVVGSRMGILQAIFEAMGGLIAGVFIGLIVGGVVGVFIGLIKQTLKVGK